MTHITFLEGPAFVGKTTFLKKHAKGNVCLPEASEYLGGDATFPAAPVDAISMAYCMYFFVYMENLRLSGYGRHSNVDACLADRFTPLSSMIFFRLRHHLGFIADPEYELGMTVTAGIISRWLRLPLATYSFVRFRFSSPEVLAVRLARGTRNTELGKWESAAFYDQQYRQTLPSGTPVLVDGSGEANIFEQALSSDELIKIACLGAAPANHEDIDKILPPCVRKEIETRVHILVNQETQQ